MDVVVRIVDDGVGVRYVLPEQPNLQTAHIADELTELAVAGDGTAWWIPGGEWNRYEYLYNKTPISSSGQAQTPLTVKLEDGTHIAFHEAARVGYPSMRSEEHTSELQSLLRISSAVFCLKPSTTCSQYSRPRRYGTV